jgi:hypothetical protein
MVGEIMQFNIGKTICKNGKNYVVTSIDDDNIRLQVLTKNNAPSRGRPIDLKKSNYNLWLNDIRNKGQFYGKVNFNFNGKCYMVTSFCNYSERLTLRHIVNGKASRGRPRIMYLSDLPKSNQLELIQSMKFVNQEFRF